MKDRPLNGLRFAWRLSVRERRQALRRVGPYMTSITLGVAALVSIHSFRADVERSLEQEADILMGANARLNADRPPPDSLQSVLDSLMAAGRTVARVTTATSMVFAPASDVVRLIQVRGIDEGYPFYGSVRTRPAGVWGAHLEPGKVLVDPAVLPQLEVEIGDTLEVGRLRLEIAGTVDDLPTELGFQTAAGPRIHLSQRTLEDAGLLTVGSLARYEIFLQMPDASERDSFRERYREVFSQTRFRFTSAEQQARRLSRGVEFLSRFLGLVGLGALLLGGIGVASAVNVYVREKRATIAVLRCLGARQGTAFTTYLIQAIGLGALGASAGVLVGIGLQWVLPGLLGDLLPIPVRSNVSWSSAAAGLGIGVWVAGAFALIPLLAVRDITPLQALRADVEPATGSRGLRAAVLSALALSVLFLCVLEAPEPETGIAFAAGLFVVMATLWAGGHLLMRLTRRLLRLSRVYTIRQGLSNLFRPRNQTVSVTVALGFGAFVIGLLLEVDHTVRRDLSITLAEDRPNLALFDIQPDQEDAIRALLPERARADATILPIASSRIAGINGQTVEELRAEDTDGDRPSGWALRREYRNTQRAEIGPAEELVSGRWWDGTPGSEDDRLVETGELPALSMEEDIARNLRVDLGDTLTWNVSGVEITAVVTSLRRVDWDRLEPNFYAIFEPGALDDVPRTSILLAKLDVAGRTEVQRALIGAFPNVSALDVSRVQEAIESVLAAARQAVGFLGGFAAFAGALVLVGALTASRFQRVREGALLRTLGARRSQVLSILTVEYLTLGTLASACGILLAAAAAAVLMPGFFEMTYRPNLGNLGMVWLGISTLTTLVGLSGSRPILARPPLPILREAAEEA